MSFSIAVHGGAGSPPPGTLDPASEARRQSGLRLALEAGAAILDAGGTALAAVVAAVEILEADPVFNAGRGSVYAADRTQRMDASVMDGATRRAGAIADVTRIASPIRAALAVAEQSPHVFLVGAGAESFAARMGLPLVDPSVFHDASRLRQLEEALASGVIVLDHSASLPDEAGGTVGAVARDTAGHLAAATSTGGMTGKAPGRVGDSAVIGAGTWADDQTCAVSATGHGERFIESNVAGRIACLVELAGLSIDEAARRVVHRALPRCGGEGGVIAVDLFGNLVMPFNSGGMTCGAIHASGRMEVFGLSRS